MAKEKKLWEFPVASTAIMSNARLFCPGGDIWLIFDYYDRNSDAIFNSGIIFEGVQAHRHICEKFLEHESKENVELIIKAYDFLVEYVDSEWVEYFRKLDKETADYWDIKHYGILLDSNGFFEFIARSFTILDKKEGRLDELRGPQ